MEGPIDSHVTSKSYTNKPTLKSSWLLEIVPPIDWPVDTEETELNSMDVQGDPHRLELQNVRPEDFRLYAY